jgi:hypothetical protein
MAGTTTALCTSFKKEILGKIHDLDSDTIKIALIKVSPTGTYGAASVNYSDITGNSDEASGTGYTAGGASLTGGALATSGTTAYADFSDVSWTSATISATAAMIYNSTASNKAISLHDFGGTQSVTGGTLTLVFPTADSSNAIIRLS